MIGLSKAGHTKRVMKYKLIVSDFDDTLLNSGYTVSAENIKAIKDYQNAGGVFTIATGRSFISMINCLEGLGLNFENVPIVTYQGGKIGYIDGRVITDIRMEHNYAVDVLEYLESSARASGQVSEQANEQVGAQVNAQSNAQAGGQSSVASDEQIFKQMAERHGVLLFIDDVLYVETYNEQVKLYEQITRLKAKVVGNLLSHVKATNAKPNAITVAAQPNIIEGYLQHFKTDSKFKALTVNTSKPYFLDILPLKAHKAEGIKALEKYFNIPQHQVIAVGDSMNDESMIIYAGLGVAVANASEYIKSIANLTVKSADDNGIAQLIQKAIASDL